MTARFHTLRNQVSPHSPLVPSTLARARRAYPSQARLGYAGAKRSASHLVLIRFRLTAPLVPSTLARARRAYPSQARLGYAGAKRSASHLVLIQNHLIHIQIMVETALFKQFCMAALLNDASVLQNGNFIGIDDGF